MIQQKDPIIFFHRSLKMIEAIKLILMYFPPFTEILVNRTFLLCSVITHAGGQERTFIKNIILQNLSLPKSIHVLLVMIFMVIATLNIQIRVFKLQLYFPAVI